MNIESPNIKQTNEIKKTINTTNNQNDSSVKFKDELDECKKNNASEKQKTDDVSKDKEVTNNKEVINNKPLAKDKLFVSDNLLANEKSLENVLEDMSLIVKEFNQSEDKTLDSIKNNNNSTDKDIMINNDFNIQENKDILPQMNPNMNFSGDGQPFSSFMNNENEQKKSNNDIIGKSAKDLAEEAAILSTMAENIAMANKTQALNDSKIIINEEGIKKVEADTGIKIETIVKFDNVIMNQADVEIFAKLVEKGEINLNEISSNSAEKAVNVSKTLADMLAKSMEKQQPLRIDFDNNISVIIRISRDGKISADFLPSSQVAEAYLKENLPLLRQRFDDENIKYNELNQRERRNPDKEQNRRKDRNNE